MPQQTAFEESFPFSVSDSFSVTIITYITKLALRLCGLKLTEHHGNVGPYFQPVDIISQRVKYPHSQ